MSQSQVIICRCGGVIAACAEPLCYQEKDWFKELREYSAKGYEIKMMSHEQIRQKFCCKCDQTELKFD